MSGDVKMAGSDSYFQRGRVPRGLGASVTRRTWVTCSDCARLSDRCWTRRRILAAVQNGRASDRLIEIWTGTRLLRRLRKG